MLASVIKIQPNHEDRIANGLNATVDQFPYMVSIRHASNLQHYCGGSILSSQWILTAGHCVEDPDPAKLIIYVGSISLKSGGFKYKVSNVILHENYSHVQTPFSLKQTLTQRHSSHKNRWEDPITTAKYPVYRIGN